MFTLFKLNLKANTRDLKKWITPYLQLTSYTTNPYKFNTNIAYIRKLKDKDVVNITLQYTDQRPRIKKTLVFQRPLNDSIEFSLERMQLKLQELLVRKMFGKVTPSEERIAHELGDVEMSLKTVAGNKIQCVDWQQLLTEGPASVQNYELKIRNETYSLALNYPYASAAKLPSCIIVGYDCYPSSLELENTTKEECVYKWFKGIRKSKNVKDLNGIKWIECGNSFSYRAKPEDVNHIFKLEITPKRGHRTGPILEIFSTSTATEDATNGFDAFKDRHLLTSQQLPADGHQFRVISYNLLADFYSDSEYSRTELFPYCPPYALSIDYRKRLILKEIRGYHGDVICLQEVDDDVFDGDLKLLLSCDGLDGWYLRKGHLPEGLATFYHTDKFSLIQTRSLNLGQGIQDEPCLAELYDKIKHNEKLCERMLALPSALQVTILKSKAQNRYLIVANTHLYSQMDAAHIRLLQMGFSMLFIQNIYSNLKTQLKLSDDNLSLIFCGDLNSLPERDIFKFMTNKIIAGDTEDFKSNEEQAVTDVSLEHSFSMQSAYDPKEVCTNYTVGFKGCLDYIYYQSDNFKIVQTIPMQSDEILSAHDAIPSIHFPSDHLALVADVEWLPTSYENVRKYVTAPIRAILKLNK